MDFRAPLSVVTPTLDGEVLRVLASVDDEFTGLQVHRLVGHSSAEGVRRALKRLVRQGVVLQRPVGRAIGYRFNRGHLAAQWISGLVRLRAQLFDQLSGEIAGWVISPVVAAVFGSVARGDAGPESDIDLFLVRPSSADPDAWDEQVSGLAAKAALWTGNDARPLEVDQSELSEMADEAVLADVIDHGVVLAGSMRTLRRAARA